MKPSLKLRREAPSADELIAALPHAVLVVDANGLIAQVNAAAEALFNTSEGHLIGQRHDQVVDLPKPFKSRVDAPYVAYDVDLQLRKGATIRVDISAVPLIDHAGWQLISVHSAIAGQRRDRGSARSAVNMASMLAHEIKNPLSGIRGAAQLLEGQVGDDNKRMTILIRDEVDRIAALIDQMQGFTDTRSREPKAENIYAIIDHVRELAANGFAAGVTISDSFDPSLPNVMVHRDSLVQILINLIKNASEAVDSNTGRIHLTTAYRHGVSVTVDGGSRRLVLPIELCVIDNGPGPPKELVDNLFEPFVSSKSSGRGLGLALADKLMRDMGGLIQFAREGTPEQTVFRLLLPRAEGK